MTPTAAAPVRLHLTLQGTVQGVGFRPFLHRLATELGLAGWVHNSCQGLAVEVEGLRSGAEEFLARLQSEKPTAGSIQHLATSWLEPMGHLGFVIQPSDVSGPRSTSVAPDLASCPECLREIREPTNRRYRYPFTTCTQCGPRFSIVESLPYDRASTTMRTFTMCAACQAEFDDPTNRRFHAQPNACPDCGPQLEFRDLSGQRLSSHDDALKAAAEALRQGKIVAVKGLGGFHLLVAAHEDAAIRRLRAAKHREEKPLALMAPDLESVRQWCDVSALEACLLQSPAAPIVLLARNRRPNDLAASVAPGNPNLGVLLPYTPLHHLLLAELGFPVVATSGNRRDEPICIDEREAGEKLGDIADFFLIHNRPILRPLDDSILRVIAGRGLMLRRARGFAPLPISMNRDLPTTLAVGAHLKNTVALSVGREVYISQHLGDLESVPGLASFQRVTAGLSELYEVRPEIIVADAHPDYLSTHFAKQFVAKSPYARLVRVQHHHAHVLSCLADNHLQPPALGVCWDGSGYGLDGTLWGGEFLRVTPTGFERSVHLRPFRLPGGDLAVREPRRAALGLLYEGLGADAFTRTETPTLQAFTEIETRMLHHMMAHDLNAPWTSSVGRLFDAVASLLNLRQRSAFEGQAAMELEFASGAPLTNEAYELELSAGILDWTPLMHDLLFDLDEKLSTAIIAAKFHHALANSIVAVATQVGEERVALTGGCFQNKYLTECAVQRLRANGFQPYWHQQVPPNDGGLALGQIAAAAASQAVASLSPS